MLCDKTQPAGCATRECGHIAANDSWPSEKYHLFLFWRKSIVSADNADTNTDTVDKVVQFGESIRRDKFSVTL